MFPVRHSGPPRPVLLASALLATSAALAALDTGDALFALHHVSQATGAFRRVAAPDTVTQVLNALHASLYYDMAAGAVLVLLLTPLSRVIRQPSRHVRAFAWVLTIVAWAMLGCGLANGPDTSGAAPDKIADAPILRAWSSLYPAWYSAAHSITVLALLTALTVVAVLLARSSLQDFYRTGHQDGPTGLWSYTRR